MTRTEQAAGAAAAQAAAKANDSGGGFSLSGIGHGILDVAGLVPVVGEPADGINAAWYGAEGDTLNSGLSAAVMIPLAGWGATGGKLAVKGAKAAEEGADAAKVAADAAAAASKRPRPDWFVRAKAGSDWHRAVQNKLIAGESVPVRFLDDGTSQALGGSDWTRELYVKGESASGYRRVDAYQSKEGSGSILSAKHTQFADVVDGNARAREAVNELLRKYPVGAEIADVPSTPRRLGGATLEGQSVLAIPIQNTPLPPDIVAWARAKGVRIAEIDIPVSRNGG